MEEKAVHKGLDTGVVEANDDKSGVRPLPAEDASLRTAEEAPALQEVPAIEVAAEDLTPEAISAEEIDVSDIALLEEPAHRTVPPPLPVRRSAASASSESGEIDFGRLLTQASRSRGASSTEFFAPIASIPAVVPETLLRVKAARRSTSLRRQVAQFVVLGSAMLVGGALAGTMQGARATEALRESRSVAVAVSAATPASGHITVLEPVVVEVRGTPAAEVRDPAAPATPAAAQEPEPEVAAAPTPIPLAARPARAAEIAPPVRAPEPTTDPVVTELLTGVAPPPDPSLAATPTRENVIEAMSAIRNQILRCANGQHGTTVVHVSVGSSGQVRQALVTGPLAGTPAGSCVARVTRTARFAPFSQPSFSFDFPYAY